MNLESKNKKYGFKRFLMSFKNSFNGFKHAYLNEQSMFIHFIAVVLTVLLGIVLKISFIEWLVIISLLVFVAIIELLNTAIESVCVAVTFDQNIYIKVAKNTSSSAVFLATLVTLIVGLIIFIPKIISLF